MKMDVLKKYIQGFFSKRKEHKRSIFIGLLAILFIMTSATVYFIFKPEEEPTPIVKAPEKNLDSLSEEGRSNNGEVGLDEAISILSTRAEVLTKRDVRKNLVGFWGSLDREGYQVEFTKSGEMIESLGPSRVAGRFELVDFNDGPDKFISADSFNTEGVFLKQILDDGRSSFYYKIVQVDDSRLVTIYLHQKGILGFNRIR